MPSKLQGSDVLFATWLVWMGPGRTDGTAGQVVFVQKHSADQFECVVRDCRRHERGAGQGRGLACEGRPGGGSSKSHQITLRHFGDDTSNYTHAPPLPATALPIRADVSGGPGPWARAARDGVLVFTVRAERGAG